METFIFIIRSLSGFIPGTDLIEVFKPLSTFMARAKVNLIPSLLNFKERKARPLILSHFFTLVFYKHQIQWQSLISNLFPKQSNFKVFFSFSMAFRLLEKKEVISCVCLKVLDPRAIVHLSKTLRFVFSHKNWVMKFQSKLCLLVGIGCGASK